MSARRRGRRNHTNTPTITNNNRHNDNSEYPRFSLYECTVERCCVFVVVERCLTALVGCWNATGRVSYEKVVVEAETGEVEVGQEAAEVVHGAAEIEMRN